MLSWNSASDHTRPLLFCLLLTTILVPAAKAESTTLDNWVWQPWITTGAGHENDLVLDPDFNRTVVPGGTFLDAVGGFRLGRHISRTVGFQLLSRTALERFLNDNGRTLLASTLLGNFRLAGDAPWAGRLTLSGDYFDDSGSATFRRLGGGLEAGLGYRRESWKAELSAFYQGRRYPRVQATTADLKVQTYTEDQLGGGMLLAWKPLAGTYLEGRLTGKSTAAVDPAFDAVSWTGGGTLDQRLGTGTWLSAAYTRQTRTFDHRNPGEDHDTYDRLGLGLSRLFSRRVRLDARYAYSTYSYPQGGVQTTTRVSLTATFLWGGSPPARTSTSVPPLPDGRPHDFRQDPLLLRLYAPRASRVAVVGDFNGWNGDALPLAKGTDGWWEVRLDLAPGTYQYAYLVDGRVRPPEDASQTVTEGFGGRNGILVIPYPER